MVGSFVKVHSTVKVQDQSGNSNAADGGCNRHDCAIDAAQVCGDEFLLELQAHEEKEDCQQPVRGPRAKAKFQMPRLVTKSEVPQGEIARGSRRISPYQCCCGSDEAVTPNGPSPYLALRRTADCSGREELR